MRLHLTSLQILLPSSGRGALRNAQIILNLRAAFLGPALLPGGLSAALRTSGAREHVSAFWDVLPVFSPF